MYGGKSRYCNRRSRKSCQNLTSGSPPRSTAVCPPLPDNVVVGVAAPARLILDIFGADGRRNIIQCQAGNK